VEPLILDASVQIGPLDAADSHHNRAVNEVDKADQANHELLAPASAYGEALVAFARAGRINAASTDRRKRSSRATSPVGRPAYVQLGREGPSFEPPTRADRRSGTGLAACRETGEEVQGASFGEGPCEPRELTPVAQRDRPAERDRRKHDGERVRELAS
jgi:hypothetical protein